jgi:hypothetical protein
MGWKGTLRSMQAAARQIERDAQRRRRELEKQRKQLEKMHELERAAYQVEVYENQIDVLLSVHKECSALLDWRAMSRAAPPVEPEMMHLHEESARGSLDTFEPGVFDKLFKRIDSKRDRLTRAVQEARETDIQEYQDALQTYEQEHADWEAACELADSVLAGDPEAYLDVITQANPWGDLAEFGYSTRFTIHNDSLIKATLCVGGEDVVPSEEKYLLKSGKLSTKKMTKTKFYALYQDHLCSCVLRLARELFALLPVEMVIVDVVSDLLNSQTGYMEEKTILSVAIPQETLGRINLERVDPSDSLNNFVHRMKFRKTRGFQAVEAIDASELV